MTIKIKRGRARKPDGKTAPTWALYCDTCSADGPLGMLGERLDEPWVAVQQWSGAMRMARWHHDLHEAQRCGICHHNPALPKPEPIKDSLFTWNGTLYSLTGGEIREMVVKAEAA